MNDPTQPGAPRPLLHVVTGVVPALLAAVLFGLSPPLLKLLLGGSTEEGRVSDVVGANAGAALVYLGSGVGLLVVLGVLALRGRVIVPIAREARLRFAFAILAGGVLAPVALLTGLATTTASAASLLLNLEGVFTAVIAWTVMRESVDRHLITGMIAIVAGGALLSFDDSGAFVVDRGALLVIAACLLWGIDNNLTQAASSADPFLVAGTKGLVAGVTHLIVALALHQRFPEFGKGAATVVVGFGSYGLSLVFFVVALRHLGTARTGAWFGAAPFVGAAVSIVVFGETVGVRFVAAAALMGLGLWLHLRERHVHEHQHEPLDHDHSHTHDEHHQHEHTPGVVVTEPHSHPHHHAPLVHSHEHTPDLHHRHGHASQSEAGKAADR